MISAVVRAGAALMACLLMPAPAGAETFRAAGVERSYTLSRPPGISGPAPTLFLLHGGFGTGARMRGYARFEDAAREAGLVLVYPDGLGRRWNDGRRGSDGQAVNTTPDAGFLAQLARDLAARGIADPDRIFFAGISNGGMMSIRMACEHAGLVAGIAVIAAQQQIGLGCRPARPVPALFLLGTEDRLIPFAGGGVGRGGRGAVRSGAETFAFWRRVNRCRGAGRAVAWPDHDPADGTRIRAHEGEGCAAPVAMLEIEGGGHTWPGRPPAWALRGLLGRTTRDIDGNAVIARFLLGGAVAPVPPRQ